MPSLAVHLSIAEEAATRINSPVLINHPGDLYLGATAPDIRGLLNIPRVETHHIELTDRSGRVGIGCFLENHPSAADFSSLSESGKAFVCGYLSHLITDASWIVSIYRPYFGEDSVLAGLPESNILDRALQFKIEERSRCLLGDLHHKSDLIRAAEGFAGIGIIADTDLRKWRDLISEALLLTDLGQQFKFSAKNFKQGALVMPPNRINGFTAAFPALAARALQQVPEEKITAFRDQAVATTISVWQQYLAGNFQNLVQE